MEQQLELNDHNKKLVIQTICRDYLITANSLVSLCQANGITKNKFYKWVQELNMGDEVDHTVNLATNVKKDEHDMDRFLDVPPEIFRKFMHIAKEYSTDTSKGLKECCKTIKVKQPYLYQWLNKYGHILKPIWAAAKQQRHQLLAMSTQDLQRDVATKALDTILDQMSDHVLTEVTKEEGTTMMGGNVIDINKKTTKQVQKKGSLKAVELALETMGLRNKKIEVTHKYEPIEVVEVESVPELQASDEDIIKQLEKKVKKV